MNPEDFKNSSAGKCIKVPEGYWAFIPNSLPPKIHYDEELISLLSDAHRLLGELSGTGKLMPNPYLLISPYIRREAVLSSRIEGTQASLNDLLLYEAIGHEKPKVPDVREVANYVRAMEHGISRLSELPLSIRLFCEMHKILMEGVRGEHTAVGELRSVQNYIGPPGCSLPEATYVPPPVWQVKETLYDLEKYLHSNAKEPPLVQCALIHYQFEAIHPFLDGNGRIGRLLIILFLCERKLLYQPILYLSAFFERFREEYYSSLLAVSQKGNWEVWVKFFLRGVIDQANDALVYVSKLLELHAKYRRLLGNTKNIPESAHRLVDEIFSNPIVSISSLSRKMNIAYTSLKNGVHRLVEIGILREMPERKRNKLFIATELMELFIAGRQ